MHYSVHECISTECSSLRGDNSERLIYFNPFSHSGHCIGQPSKISILVQEGIIENISYELRAYESVDDKSPILGHILKNMRNGTRDWKG